MAHKKYLTKEAKLKSLAINNSKYWKTPKGKVMATYNNMNGRVRGIQKSKVHLYGGLGILPRDEFYAWALANEDYLQLFKDWVLSNHDRKLSPSIDRIDTSIGYELSNMRWLTHSENSRLGAISKWGNVKMEL